MFYSTLHRCTASKRFCVFDVRPPPRSHYRQSVGRTYILFPHEWLIITVIYTQICPSKIIEHTRRRGYFTLDAN